MFEICDAKRSSYVLPSFIEYSGTDSKDLHSTSGVEYAHLSDCTLEISTTATHDEIVSMSIMQNFRVVCELNALKNMKQAVLQQRHPVSLDHIWTTISTVLFNTTFSWKSAVQRGNSSILQVARVSLGACSKIKSSYEV